MHTYKEGDNNNNVNNKYNNDTVIVFFYKQINFTLQKVTQLTPYSKVRSQLYH